MHKKHLSISFVLLFALTSCNNIASIQNANKKDIGNDNLDAFQTKDLTQAYIDRKLNGLIANIPTSCPKIARELRYSQDKMDTIYPLDSLIQSKAPPAADAFFDTMDGCAEVTTLRGSDPTFDAFMTSIDPSPSCYGTSSTFRTEWRDYV